MTISTILTRRASLGASLLAALERERNAAHHEVDEEFNTIKNTLTSSSTDPTTNGMLPTDLRDAVLPRSGRGSAAAFQLSTDKIYRILTAVREGDTRLTPKQLQLLKLRYEESRSNKEIARALGYNNGSGVSYDIRKAINKLGMRVPKQRRNRTTTRTRTRRTTRNVGTVNLREELLG